jgi:hypothetical protein
MLLLRIFVITICLRAISLAGLLPLIPQEHRVILEGDWTPTAVQTQNALEAIQRRLETPLREGDIHDRKSLERIRSGKLDYYVQFIGRREQGRDIIACIFFLPDQIHPRVSQHWREREIAIADAGAEWWWDRYDPATGRVE